jgi:hypothetical protein
VSDVYGTQRRPRKRWGRRLLVTFIVLLIIVGGAAVVLDRFAASYAERMISDKVAEQVANQKATSDKPDVTIEGVPFLTQVLKGTYQEIKIELADFAGPAGDNRTIQMPLLDIRALDVDAPLDTIRSGNGDIVASTVSGIGTIDYTQLAKLINQPGLKLSAKDGKLIGSAPVQALGQTYNVSGAATLTVKDGTVQVRFSDVTAEGLPDIPLVRTLINAYAQKLGVDLKVPALPLKLALKKVEPQTDGLKVTAEAHDVSLNSGGL